MKVLIESTKVNILSTYHILREPFKNYLADFVPLNGKSFCQKILSGKGGYPPSLNGKSTKKFLKKKGQKGLKLALFGQK